MRLRKLELQLKDIHKPRFSLKPMKESMYNLYTRDMQGNCYLFNTRQGAVLLIAADVYQSYREAVTDASNRGSVPEVLRDLVDRGFLVDNDADELSEVLSMHNKARQSRDYVELLIAPSMACNLDCFYCFEPNRYAGRMTTAVQDNVVRLVRRYFEHGARRLDVTWYGGEPLLAFPVVERLSNKFLALREEFDCRYSAVIVTNGILMTEDKGAATRFVGSKRA